MSSDQKQDPGLFKAYAILSGSEKNDQQYSFHLLAIGYTPYCDHGMQLATTLAGRQQNEAHAFQHVL